MKILVLSGSDHIRFPTMINQRAFSDRHGYEYRFDISPRPERSSIYYHKLAAIMDALPAADWLFWIDDDAAFTQLDTSFEALVPELQSENLSAIFCASPINPSGGWTFISSGNFFVRNDSAGRALIECALRTNLTNVEQWWNQEQLGIFTGGDQDALVYQIKNHMLIKSRVAILEYDRFNTRPYHFKRPGQHFLVHFTHLPETTKEGQMVDFCSKFGLSRHFLSERDAAPYASYDEPLMRHVPWAG